MAERDAHAEREEGRRSSRRVEPAADPLGQGPVSLFLGVDAEPALLVLVRHTVRVWLGGVGCPGSAARPIVYVVDEAVGNAIEHAYGERAGRLTVELTVEHGRPRRLRVCVVVTDFGRWRPEDPDRDRGNGLALIRALADSVHVVTGRAGTRVTVRLDVAVAS